MKIQYSYCDGQTINIEVEDSLGEIIIHLERDEFNTNRRETRRHESYSNDNDKMDGVGRPMALATRSPRMNCNIAIRLTALHGAPGQR